ncbi:M50 family metallopeptidase [Dehalobacter sp. DCM]|uniref:M50 family metallopeptidase n=1 Tax=Dehalobacter sp. DCM TaxID=2907827 RepID=UPI003081DD1D|nr:M50 family metallopeptidase [Dehalobacter sp. DCM]
MQVKVHPTFIALLIVCFLAGQFTRALLVFGLVILHECCHILTARGFGINVLRVELYPYGGTAILDDRYQGNKKEETIIALAGPAFNISLFIVIQVLRGQGILIGEWALELAKINFWLASFNLLPVLPLDGGRIARGLFAGAFGFIPVTRFLAAAGKWTGGFFVFIGLLLQAFGLYIYEPTVFIILGIFFWIGSSKEMANARIVFLKQLCRKKERLFNQGLLAGNTLTVHRDTKIRRVIDGLTTDHYSLIYVLGKDDVINRTFSESEVVQGMMDHGLDYPVYDLKK